MEIVILIWMNLMNIMMTCKELSNIWKKSYLKLYLLLLTMKNVFKLWLIGFFAIQGLLMMKQMSFKYFWINTTFQLELKAYLFLSMLNLEMLQLEVKKIRQLTRI